MYKTVGDLITALQKFPPTAQVQADNKTIQNVSVLAESVGEVVQISTTAPVQATQATWDVTRNQPEPV